MAANLWCTGCQELYGIIQSIVVGFYTEILNLESYVMTRLSTVMSKKFTDLLCTNSRV